MRVEFVGNKARMASEKHFGGKLDDAQMKLLVIKVIKNAKYVGVSDRANAGHTPARIIWGEYNNTLFAVVIDGEDVKKGKATVVSFYDVQNAETKAKRFNMKEVK